MRPLRVLHIVYDLEVAGVQTVVSLLVRHTERQRVVPVVCAWKGGGPIRDEIEAAGVETHVPAPGTGLWSVYRLLKTLIATHRIDVIHGHMSDGAFWGGLLSRRTGLPLVLSFYSNSLLSHRINRASLRGRVRFQMLKRGAHRARVNIACADSVKQQVMDELGLSEERVQVIPNGVPLPTDDAVRQAASERGRPGAEAGRPFRLVTVGRLDEVKSQDVLIRAAPLVLEEIPDLQFVIVGDGARLDDWQALARELGVDGRIEFTGRVKDSEPFFTGADAYVSTSRYEGTSLAVLEAMGWGLPVIASDVVGNRDAVEHGETGMLFPYGDERALAAAIVALARDEGARSRVAANGREQVLRRFSVARMIDNCEAVYRRVVGADARPPETG